MNLYFVQDSQNPLGVTVNLNEAVMIELLRPLWEQVAHEVVGMIGGAIFLGSWVLQAYESRRKGVPTVSTRFFILRSLASALLTFEGIRSGSLSVTLVMFATLLLMLYNIYLSRKRATAATGT